MSYATTTLAAVSAAVTFAVAGVYERVVPERLPIVVHALQYQAECSYQGVDYVHCIEQDRTVQAEGDTFYMFWDASIRDATGKVVEACAGSGSWKYKVSRIAVSMPLAIWTGNEACTIDALEPGVYTPVAVWYFGDKQVTKTGEAFEVRK